ncbi:MAG: RagB/SusD family nutrient uptake outer membrane protein [Mangrovibacterium sp.]
MKIKILTVLFVYLSVSCNNYLDETAYNKITPGNYYSTPEGILSGVNGVYSKLRSIYIIEAFMYLAEGASSDIYYAPSNTNRFYSWNITADMGELNSLWSACYVSINQANEVIAQLEKGVDGLNENLRIRYLGEVRFLRSFFYYHLVMQWGDVYLTTSPTKTIETEAYRTPSSEIWDFILTELDFCISNLPDEYTSDYGRITTNAARQFKALALLTAKRNDESSVAEALKLGEDIINSGKYELEESHADLFSMSNMRNKEIIFPVLYTVNSEYNGDGNTAHLYFTCAYSEEHPGVKRVIQYGRPWGRLRPTKFMMNLFDEDIDERFEDDFRDQWDITENSASFSMFNPNTKQTETITMKKGDVALKIFKKMPTPDDVKAIYPVWGYLPDEYYGKLDIQSESNPNGAWPSNTKFQNYKFYIHTTKHSDPLRATINETRGTRDVYVFRLAETYLIAAEAATLLNDKEKAAEYINVVRARAAKTGRESEMEISSEQVSMDFILDERARELQGEMQRWYDLRRTGKLLERVRNAHAGDATYLSYVKDYHALRPIPENQLTRMSNPEDFPQNPGY